MSNTTRDESGATVWEIREMARRVENSGVVDLIRKPLNEVVHDLLGEEPDHDEIDDAISGIGIVDFMSNAILVEALNCLADRKEAERGR